MGNDPLFLFRVLSGIAFVVTLVIGVYLAKNHQKILGVDNQIPSENASSRVYNTAQVWIMWSHAALLFGAGALFF